MSDLDDLIASLQQHVSVSQAAPPSSAAGTDALDSLLEALTGSPVAASAPRAPAAAAPVSHPDLDSILASLSTPPKQPTPLSVPPKQSTPLSPLKLDLSSSPSPSPAPVSPSTSQSDTEDYLASLQAELSAVSGPRPAGSPLRKPGSRICQAVSHSLSPRTSKADQTAELADLTNYAFDSQNIDELLAYDAQLVFQRALESDDPEQIELAAQALTNLCAAEQGRQAIREATVKALCQQLRAQYNQAVLAAKLLGAAVNMCHGSARNRQLLINFGAWRALDSLLAHNDKATVNNALGLLTNILSDGTGQHSLLAEAPDLPRLIVRASISHDELPGVIADSLRVFSVISRGDRAFLSLWVEAGLPRILPRLAEVCTLGQRDAELTMLLTVFVNLAAIEDFIPHLEAAGAIPALQRLLAAALPAKQATLTVQALQNLSTVDATCRLMASHGVPAAALQLLRAASDATLLEYLLRLLQNLSADAAIRAHLKQLGALAVVQAHAAPHAAPSVRHAAAACLNNIEI
jgi:hypothetical protein